MNNPFNKIYELADNALNCKGDMDLVDCLFEIMSICEDCMDCEEDEN